MLREHKIKVIGRREFVDLDGLGLKAVEAKIDTGAYSSSLHCENIMVNYEDQKPVLYFTILPEDVTPRRFEKFGKKNIKNSFGEMEERFIIKTTIRIGKKNIPSTISLSNRDHMRYPLLIGRRILKGKFLIDPNQIHTGGISLKKAVKTVKPK